MTTIVEELVTQGVNSLVRIVSDNVTLVRGIDSEIKDLTSDIQMFNARLIEASKNPRADDHQVLRLIVNKFGSVVNEAEDTIADYVVLKKKHGNNFFLKSLDKTPYCGKVNGYASEIQSIRTKMNAIRQDHEKEVQDLMQYEIKEQDKAVKTFHQDRPIVEKNEVFGFEKDLKDMKARLLEASNNFIVIPIVGMPGTGKTTFASMLFNDLRILNNLVCIWVHVSKWCDIKQKFISIIYQITKSTEDLTTKSEEILKGTIQNRLKDQKYFIILDDVWRKEDWDSLQTAFPKNMNGSRVVLTTRHDNVVDSIWKSHNLGMLSDDDGWLLIKNNVFGTEGCNDKFLAIGMEIARKCKGLPLALAVVAGILRKCRTSTDWQRVAENPLLEINREYQSYHEIVKMSYNDLPHEKLKNCFLYFAYFPMGHEIAIWKLVCLWIAEGFIPTINEWEYRINAEVEAQKYLDDLIDRNLVTLIKRRADSQIKTCRIHDTLHEFCKSEAARKKLFLVMDKEQSRLDENTCSARRLCFHSFTDDENKSSILLSPFGKHIHSLFLSSPQKSEVRLAPDELTTIPNIFPLLRVLNIEYIEFVNNMLPKEVYRLYLLKYIAISGNLNLLPKSFKNLVELETLVIKTTARTLQIVGGIWNMEKLRHVCTNTSAQLPFPPKTSKANSGGKNILTLSTISPESCTKEIFRRTPNLQKLGVRGNLSQLLEGKQETCLFNNLQLLKRLLNLKLYGQHNEGLTVPMLDKFACRLKKLSFSGTRFEWKDMRVLGLLEELEVLKLDDYAFKGENWELSNDVVFKRLQYLRIGKTNLKTWMVTENSFPTLRSLNLQNCSSLLKIPQAFAKVHTLKVMVLFNVRESATQSAKGVRESIKSGGFKLNITSVKQRALYRTSVKDQKARNEAMKIAVRFSGVESASIQEKGHLEVIGDFDAVQLVCKLRKRSRQAELISVGPVNYEKKEEKKAETPVPQTNTSTSSQEIEHKQSYGQKNASPSGFDRPSTSTPSQEIVSDDD
ncbi:putative late blight resistance protein homolog R1B-17 [Ipomoea triloba]|uniref:putative late blight resistance protein homolog R1B-17 n=1 Tax=Ipomoea triloba TaxID=35885 RepID=UPI00125D6347|nr:putative late blight resistance protein homolog R1B-17 [Ipomoea triloba]